MAKRTSRRAGADRSARTKSRKPAATEVEVVEEDDGGGIDAGIVIITTVILVAAFLVIDALRGTYDEGLFM
jgi:hypothetical protein